MARYTGPVCKLCRREGTKMYLKGERCYTDKCGFSKRSFAPGQHGQGRKKLSEYGIQLREKQKAKRIYGVLEKQFRRYFGLADRQKGITGENLLRILERRLDNVVYKLGLATSRIEARQLVNHGHFTLNGKKVNIPSLLVKIGDKVAVAEKSKESEKFKVLLEEAGKRALPAWLEYDANAAAGTVVRFPTREEIDSPISEHLIVELYSK